MEAIKTPVKYLTNEEASGWKPTDGGRDALLRIILDAENAVICYVPDPDKRAEIVAAINAGQSRIEPCPYYPCKGAGRLQLNAGTYYVYCLNCGRHTDSFQTEAEAINAWNTTQQPCQPGELVKRMLFNFDQFVETGEFGYLVREDIKQAAARIDELEKACRGIWKVIEDGLLVRNISRNDESGWAIKQLPLVMALKDLQAALGEEAEDGSN